MLTAAIGADELASQIGVPVLDPLKIGLRAAETVAELAQMARRVTSDSANAP